MELESILLPGIEAKRPIVIAGPCSAETEEQVMETAKQLANKRPVSLKHKPHIPYVSHPSIPFSF